jgi:hypothetical protein
LQVEHMDIGAVFCEPEIPEPVVWQAQGHGWLSSIKDVCSALGWVNYRNTPMARIPWFRNHRALMLPGFLRLFTGVNHWQ